MSKQIITSRFPLFFLLSLFSLFPLFSQDDARSQKIIDDMTAKFKTYPNVFLDFSLTITQLQDQSETAEQEGKLWVKGNKYKLEIPDYVIYFDGSKIYQYMPEYNEVNIMPKPDESDEDFQLLNPQSYFNLSSKTFKSNLVKESAQNNRKVYEIDLYPIQLKTTTYSRIRIMIEKSTLQMVYLKAFMKDGTHYALSFKPYEIPKPALRDAFFTFNPIEHPGVEVVDLTF